MKDLYKRYKEASEEYVESEKLNSEVIGILVSGSLKYSTIDKNSDIDIHVILDPKCNYRERGNLWINGIEIEYFKNPPQQIRSYFEREKKSPHTAHMFTFGEMVYSKSEICEEMAMEAKAIIKEKPLQLKAFEIELEKYFIDDYYKDLEDAIINKNQLGSRLIRSKIVNRSIDVFFSFHQERRGKDKRLNNQLELLDSNFCRKVENAFNENWDGIVYINELRVATENLLGGRRNREWKLRSNLDL